MISVYYIESYYKSLLQVHKDLAAERTPSYHRQMIGGRMSRRSFHQRTHLLSSRAYQQKQ
jgi:hypothetical protein